MRKYQPSNSSFSIFYREKKAFDLRDHKKEAARAHLLPGQDEGAESHLNEANSRMSKLILPTLDLKAFPSEMSGGESHRKYGGVSSRLYEYSAKAEEAKSQRALSNKSLAYLNKIKDIERMGEVAQSDGEGLIKKASLAIKILEGKYSRLERETAEMTEDVGSYQLEEETSPEYRKELRQMWMRN